MVSEIISFPILVLVLFGIALIALGMLFNYFISVRKLMVKLFQAEKQSIDQNHQNLIQQKLFEQQSENNNALIEKFRVRVLSLEERIQQEAEQCQQLSISKASNNEKISHLENTNKEQYKKLIELEQHQKELQQQLAKEQSRVAQISIQFDDEKMLSKEKMRLLEQTKEKMSQQFSELANKIMENNADRFGKQQQQNLSTILDPFKEQLGEFRKRVDHVYDTESRDRVTLLKEIDGLRQLNQKITEEASNLTRALKGDRKAQGNWGEMILERVLEASGLQKGREYETQKHLKSETKERYHPDVIIHLPENKDIIVDAKVSLSAYERYFSCDDEKQGEIALKQHLLAVRSHVDKLSQKKYEELEGINTLDFVFIFIPIEPAYLLALQEDSNLLTDAFAKKIIIVSPTTLLATLRIIENIWRFERQSKNAVEIAQQAGRMYDKFSAFVKDLDEVENRLVRSMNALKDAKNKLHSGNGNLIRSSEKLRLLGAKTSKLLDKQLLEKADE